MMPLKFLSQAFSVTMIHGGTKENIIPDRCELTLDRRMIPGETSETVLAELKQVIDPIIETEKELRDRMENEACLFGIPISSRKGSLSHRPPSIR